MHRHHQIHDFDLFCARWYPVALVACGVVLFVSALF